MYLTVGDDNPHAHAKHDISGPFMDTNSPNMETMLSVKLIVHKLLCIPTQNNEPFQLVGSFAQLLDATLFGSCSPNSSLTRQKSLLQS